MLKKVTLLSLILGITGIAVADTAPKAISNVKIVIVNLPKTMESEAVSSQKNYVIKLQADQEAIIKKMDAKLKKQQEALQAKSKVADLDALEKDQEKLNDAIAKRDLAAKSAGEKIRRAADSVMRKLSKIAQEAAEVLRKKLNVDLVLSETGAVVAYSKRVDVTDDLIKEMIKLQNSSKKTSVKTTKSNKKK